MSTIQTEYFPFGTARWLMVMSWLVSRVVAQFAPGVQTSPQCATLVPKIGLRSRVARPRIGHRQLGAVDDLRHAAELTGPDLGRRGLERRGQEREQTSTDDRRARHLGEILGSEGATRLLVRAAC
ncbi:MAG: hypothetical protein V9E87_00260 [Gemmatimonadales bacterium]